MSKLENYKYIDDNKLIKKYEITPMIDISNNLDDHFIGVMGIAFNEEYKLSKEDWIFIRQKVGAIGLLLTDYLKTKK